MLFFGVSRPVPTRKVAEDVSSSGSRVVWKIHIGRPLSYGPRIALLGRRFCLFECP